MKNLKYDCYRCMFYSCSKLKFVSGSDYKNNGRYIKVFQVLDNPYIYADGAFKYTKGEQNLQSNVQYYLQQPYNVYIDTDERSYVLMDSETNYYDGDTVEFKTDADVGYKITDVRVVRTDDKTAIELNNVEEDKNHYSFVMPEADVKIITTVSPDPEAIDKNYDNNCITFSSNSTFSLSVKDKGWDGFLYYSIDKTNWKLWNGNKITASTRAGKYQLYLRGVGNKKIAGGDDDGTSWQLDGSGISCDGNIENLLDYKVVADNLHPEMEQYCFQFMFRLCTSLIKAPELGATDLKDYCYSRMFEECTNLVEAPELAAMNLASSCYENMFLGCTSLTKAPELNATELKDECYYAMFENCTSLVKAPELNAEQLAIDCYYSMFEGCTSLVETPELKATKLFAGSYQRMFAGCTSLVKISKFEADELDYCCCKCMFEGCTSLVEVPELKATELKEECYLGMFSGCSNLKIYENDTEPSSRTTWSIPSGGNSTNWTSDYDSDAMFYNTGGDFKGNPVVGRTYYMDVQTQYAVTYLLVDENGKLVKKGDTKIIKANDKAENITITQENGYKYDDWYSDIECKQKFDFSKPITENIFIYAKGTYRQLNQDSFDIDLSDIEYTGDNIEPIVKPKDGKVITEKDYTVSYKNNVYAAKADSDNPPTIVIAPTKDGAYCYSDILEISFTINKKKLDIDWGKLDGLKIEAGKKLSDVSLPEDVKDKFAWVNPAETVSYGNTAKYAIKYLFNDHDNYEYKDSDLVKEINVEGLDVTAPVIEGIEDKASYSNTKPVKITVTDEHLKNVSVNGKEVSSKIEDNSDGSKKVSFELSEVGDYKIVATDEAGNSTTKNISLFKTNVVVETTVAEGTSSESGATPTTRVTETEYPDVETAVAAIKTSSDNKTASNVTNVVKVLSDVGLTSNVELPVNTTIDISKNVIFDLNGKNITSEAVSDKTSSESEKAVVIISKNEGTIKDSSVTKSTEATVGVAEKTGKIAGIIAINDGIVSNVVVDTITTNTDKGSITETTVEKITTNEGTVEKSTVTTVDNNNGTIKDSSKVTTIATNKGTVEKSTVTTVDNNNGTIKDGSKVTTITTNAGTIAGSEVETITKNNNQLLATDFVVTKAIYTGNAVTPEIKLAEKKSDDKRLDITANDYDIVLDKAGYTNAGTYEITINGKGNYSGCTSVKVSFVIAPKHETVDFETGFKGLTAKEGDSLGTVTLPVGYSWADKTIKVSKGSNEYEVIYTPADTNNYSYDKLSANVVVVGTEVETPPTGDDNKQTTGDDNRPITSEEENKPSTSKDATQQDAKQAETTIAPQVAKENEKVEVANIDYKVTSVEKDGTGTVTFSSTSKDAKSVTIPKTIEIDGKTFKVTAIEKNAFKDNKKLTKVTLGSNIVEIKDGAFTGCTALKTVTIPKNVTKLGKGLFKGCKKLKTISIKTTKLTSKDINKNAFKGLHKNVTIKVPKKCLKAYKKLFKKKGLDKKVKVIA